MDPEAILWYTSKVISSILGSFTAYMVLKYLNKKPLGMQTVFDEIIKDFIYVNMLDCLIFNTSEIAVTFFAPFNHYVMSTMMICRLTVAIAVINQLSILMVIRYLYVFYPSQMNDAHFAKNFARLFLVYISFTTALFVDKKNTPFYYIASGQNIENGFDAKTDIAKPISNLIVFSITMGVCGMILVFTQCKIEKFNRSVASQQQDVQVEENQNSSDRYRNSTIRIALIILFLLLTSVTMYHLLVRRPWVNILDILRTRTLKEITLYNIIPMIFIVRNDTLFCFVKIQILKILKCKCKNNQIEPMIELNVL